MTDAMPDGDVVKLPPPKNAPRLLHKFGAPLYVAPALSASGFEQHERTCAACGAVKITILDRQADSYRRAWRTSAAAEQVETFVAPACVPMGQG